MSDSTASTSFGQCGHCGRWHDLKGICPHVKAIEYHPNGMVKRVEYYERCEAEKGVR
jgi:hypothetical protein